MSPSGSRRRGARLARCAALAVALATPLDACGGSDGTAAEARADAEPFLGPFAEFDAWGRRVLSTERDAPDSAALAETLFAPLLGEERVLEAWVARHGSQPKTWSFRGSPKPDLSTGFVLVRDASLGVLRVGRVSLDDPRTNVTDPVRVVIVSRAGRPTPSTTIDVTVAFVL